MENTFYPQDTNCAGCIFEEIIARRDIGYGLEFGCKLKKLDLYKEKGLKVESSNLNWHYTIKDFICPYYRTKEWATDLIKKENKLPYFVILLHLDSVILEGIIEDLLEYDAKPQEIFIVTKFISSEKREELQDLLNKILKNSKIKWTLQYEIEENSWHQIINNYKRKDFMMLITGEAKTYEKENLFKKLSSKIQDELLTFSYAEAKNIKLIPAYSYNSYYFEYTKNWLQKLEEERCHEKYIL